MKHQATPVINCHRGDRACVAGKLETLCTFTDRVHLDIADARFTPHASWAEPDVWREIGKGVQLEAHLMVEDPAMVIGGWLDAGAKRIIIHLESLQHSPYRDAVTSVKALVVLLKKICDAHGAVFVLALNPETPVEAVLPYAGTVDEYLLLAVYPGPAGQPFLPATLAKITALRRHVPNARIEVDGGVTAETARKCYEAGADSVCAGSAVFSSSDPAAAFTALEQ